MLAVSTISNASDVALAGTWVQDTIASQVVDCRPYSSRYVVLVAVAVPSLETSRRILLVSPTIAVELISSDLLQVAVVSDPSSFRQR